MKTYTFKLWKWDILIFVGDNLVTKYTDNDSGSSTVADCDFNPTSELGDIES